MKAEAIRQALFLDQRDLVLSDNRAVDAIGQFKSRVDPNVWIARLDVLFDEKFQCEIRHLDAIERNRIYVNVTLATTSVRVRVNINIVYASKYAEQRIGRMDSSPNLIKVYLRGATHPALRASQVNGVYPSRELHFVRRQVCVDFGFSKHRRSGVRMRRPAVCLEVRNFAIDAGEFGRSLFVRSRDRNGNNHNVQQESQMKDLHGFREASAFGIAETRVLANVPLMTYPPAASVTALKFKAPANDAVPLTV